MESKKASAESQHLADELFAKCVSPTNVDVAEYLDIVRAIEYKECSRVGVHAVIRAQLEVIGQCIDMVEKGNKSVLVTPGAGPKRTIDKVVKAMKAEYARLKGMDEYVPPTRKSTIIVEPNTVALPKGDYK